MRRGYPTEAAGAAWTICGRGVTSLAAARATIIVSADHGFADYSKNINPGVMLREKGWLGRAGEEGRVTFLSEGGAGMFYIRDAAERAAITAELVPLLRATEGVEMVFPASEYASIGHVSPEQDPREPLIRRLGCACSDFHGTSGLIGHEPGSHLTQRQAIQLQLA